MLAVDEIKIMTQKALRKKESKKNAINKMVAIIVIINSRKCYY